LPGIGQQMLMPTVVRFDVFFFFEGVGFPWGQGAEGYQARFSHERKQRAPAMLYQVFMKGYPGEVEN